MRTGEEVTSVLALQASGLGATVIARRTGIPRSTVRGWMEGTVPSRLQAGSSEDDRLPVDLPAYVYLLGIYLGDGCISAHRRGVFRLRLNLDLRYPDNRVNRLNRRSHYTGLEAFTHVEVSCYSKRWPELIPQHGPGRKHERSITLEPWQEEAVRASPEQLLRGLIHSDGCRSINTGRNWSHPRYSFSNRSEDIRRIFCWGCDLLGLRWTTAPHTVYVSRKADVARLDTFIGPKA